MLFKDGVISSTVSESALPLGSALKKSSDLALAIHPRRAHKDRASIRVLEHEWG